VTFPRGPAVLSLRTGAPLIPVFLIREGPWRFRFSVGSPILPPQGPWADAQVQEVTQAYVKVLEHQIRQCPTQWLMLRPIPGEPTPEMANCELSIAN
jgi:KDO2-lipid IV(A) lauroyltransferase